MVLCLIIRVYSGEFDLKRKVMRVQAVMFDREDRTNSSPLANLHLLHQPDGLKLRKDERILKPDAPKPLPKNCAHLALTPNSYELIGIESNPSSRVCELLGRHAITPQRPNSDTDSHVLPHAKQ